MPIDRRETVFTVDLDPAMSALSYTEQTAGRANLRAYLAGTGVTGALIAGALAIFAAVAAFVAFNALPLGGAGGSEGSILVGQQAVSGAPESAAVAVGGASAAIAGTPAAPVGTGTPAQPLLVATGTGGQGILGPGNVGDAPSGGGPLGNVLGNVDDTAGSVGLDLNLGPTTQTLTDPIDQTVRGTLNSVGSALGAPNLGDNTNTVINGVADLLLGPNGIVHRLLGGSH